MEDGAMPVGSVTPELLSRARAGSHEAFREITEPYLRELRLHAQDHRGDAGGHAEVLRVVAAAEMHGVHEQPGDDHVEKLRPGAREAASYRHTAHSTMFSATARASAISEKIVPPRVYSVIHLYPWMKLEP